MICCSCHTPTITYIMKKSPNDKPKGAHHTPGRGVVGTLRLVDSLKPYAPDSVGWMMEDGCIRMSPPKKAEFKDETARDETARRNGHLYNVNKTAAHTSLLFPTTNFLIYITIFSNRNHNATVAPTILLLY